VPIKRRLTDTGYKGSYEPQRFGSGGIVGGIALSGIPGLDPEDFSNGSGGGGGGGPDPDPFGLGLTPEELVIARFKRSQGLEEIPPKLLAGAAHLNPIQLPGQAWKPLETDIPLILRPTAPLFELIYYAPGRIPLNQNLLYAQRSIGPGIVYLPTRGQWWLYYNATATITLLMIDAQDPLVAARYLGERSSHYITTTITTALPINTANPVQLLPSNMDRRGVLMRNVSNTVTTIRYQWNGSTAVPLAQFGELRQNEEEVFFGDSNVSGALVAQSDDLLVTADISVQSFF